MFEPDDWLRRETKKLVGRMSAVDAALQLNEQLTGLAEKHGFQITEPLEILGNFTAARMVLKGARALGNELIFVQL